MAALTYSQLEALNKLAAESGYATPTHTSATAGTASSAMLAANLARKYALIQNDSDTVVYIALGADAVANKGIRLNISGGAYEMSPALGNLYTGAINAIASASKTVLVTEGT